MTSHAAKKTPHVRIKRAYDPPQNDDGYRVFVDRLWPRGVSKEHLEFDEWNKDLAPSPALRTWFGHKVENWDGFNESYRSELHTPEQKKRMQDLIAAAQGQPITLVYGAKDPQHNHALILAAEINSLY
ncbi:MAG TPA: DUF488 domain-containing protein [Candidimonas sp.]|nr:DUF488 domain-containing protein [Candidimonas sp.]